MKKIYGILTALSLLTLAGCYSGTSSLPESGSESVSESSDISAASSKSEEEITAEEAWDELPAGTGPDSPVLMHNGIEYTVDTHTPICMFYTRVSDGQNADIFTGEPIDAALDKCISSENLVGTLADCSGKSPANELESTAYAGYQLYDDGSTVVIAVNDYDFVCAELRGTYINHLAYDEYTLDSITCLFTCSPTE